MVNRCCNVILTKKLTVGISFVLLLCFFVQISGSTGYHSLSMDEALYISKGFGYLKTGNFDMQVDHPPLTMILSGAPLLLLGAEFPQESWNALINDAYANDLLYISNTNTYQLVYWARFPMILLGILLGILVYQWSSRLYGPKGGLFSLFIFCFNPIMISYFQFVLTDVVMTVFVFSAVFAFYTYLGNPSTKSLLITGFLFGLALLSKVLSLFLIPLFIFLFLLSSYRNKFSNDEKIRVLATIFGISFLVMWAGYGFETGTISSKTFNPDRVDEPIEKLPDLPFVKSGGKFFMENVPIPFPNYFKAIYIHSTNTLGSGRPIYLLGDVALHGGFREYYIVSFLLKTPVPLIIFMVGALWGYWKTRERDEILFLLSLIILYFIAASINPIQEGVRYILYLYPFIAVLSGKLAEFDYPKTRPIVLVLILWYVIGTVSVYPHYESYYNEIAGGGDDGYKYLIGRSDGGQQLKLLGEYVAGERIDEIKIVKYGGWIPYELEYRDIKYQNLTCDKTTGIVVLGAKELQGESRYGEDCFSWLKDYKPMKRICHTLFVYNVTLQNMSSI